MPIINKLFLAILILTMMPLALFTQTWTTPEIIFENPNQGSSLLSVKIEKNGRMHFVLAKNIDDNPNSDSLFYIQKMGSYISSPISLFCDTSIFSVKTALDLNNNLHVAWGEGVESSDGILNIYYSSIKDMNWTSQILVKNLDNYKYKPHEVNLLALHDSSLFTYWYIFHPPQQELYTISFRI